MFSIRKVYKATNGNIESFPLTTDKELIDYCKDNYTHLGYGIYYKQVSGKLLHIVDKETINEAGYVLQNLEEIWQNKEDKDTNGNEIQ